MAIARASSGFGVSFFKTKNAVVTHRGFAVLLGWASTTALPIDVHTHSRAPATFLTDGLLKLFHFVQSTFQVERPSVRNKDKPFGTLSSMSVLPQ